MELPNHVASEFKLDEPLQTSNPKPNEVQDSLKSIRVIEDAVNLLTSPKEQEPTDDLDVRLAEGRRRRAQTFSKVTNLFNKIFAE